MGTRGYEGTARDGTGRDGKVWIFFGGGIFEWRDGEKFPFVYRGMGMGREGGKPFG